MLAMQSRDQIKNQFGGTAIEIAGGLIGQQNLGPGDERPGQRKALLFASREFA